MVLPLILIRRENYMPERASAQSSTASYLYETSIIAANETLVLNDIL